MKISEIIKTNDKTLSFEVFPPKKQSSFESVKTAIEEIAKLKPHFMSVTYGAGGGTSEYTLEIAKSIKASYGVSTIAHLTCVSSTKETVRARIEELKKENIENVLALRGDIPEELLNDDRSQWAYNHATDLIKDIKSLNAPFCLGGACYPEKHPESATKEDDILHLKEKVDAGCEFFTTQMFFDNNLYYSFVEELRKKNIDVPVIAGIMPLTAKKQIERSISLSGSYIPKEFLDAVEKCGDDTDEIKKVGIDYAISQIRSLYEHGVKNIHLYSMNKPEVASFVQSSVFDYIK